MERKKKSTALPLRSTMLLFSRNFPLRASYAPISPVSQAENFHNVNPYLGNFDAWRGMSIIYFVHIGRNYALRLLFITTIRQHRSPIFDDWRTDSDNDVNASAKIHGERSFCKNR